MKEHILFIVLVIAALGIGYYVGCELTNADWNKRFYNAPSKRDTVFVHDTIRPPKEEKKFYNQPSIPPQRRIQADSVFNAGMQKGIDSVASLFAWYTAKEETTVAFETGDTVQHWFDPLTRVSWFGLQPAPKLKETIFITDSIYVPTPSEQAWYDHWYIGALGAVLVFIGFSQL